jgi:hypothetical protein
MDLWSRTPSRLLCTEPLEGRWLLSGLAADADDDADDNRDGDGDVQSATSALPAAVLAAITARFPNARLLEAEIDDDDGEPVYEVLADHDGRTIELTVADDGAPLETEAVPRPGSSPAPHGVDGIVERAGGGDVTPPPISSRPPVSGPDPAPAPAPNSGSTVQVVEVAPAEDDEADGDVDVAPSRLPKAVLAAFNARFPGARVIEAEWGLEDDGRREYDITAEFRGQTIGATLMPGGEIVETGQALTAGELPPAVLEWVRREFGDASIEKASVRTADGVLSYEVLIASPPGGGPDVEATLFLPGATAPPILLATGEAPSRPPEPGPAAIGPDADTMPPRADGGASDQTDTAGPPDEPVVTAPQASDDATPAEETPAAAAAAPGDGADRHGDGVATGVSAAAARAAGAAQTAGAPLAPGDGPPAAAWLPELAGVLGDVLPLDVDAVQRRLDDVLARLDDLAGRAIGTEVAGGGVSPLVMLAALVAATHLLRLGSRRDAGGPVLVFDGAASTWSWVLGDAPAPRRATTRSTAVARRG